MKAPRTVTYKHLMNTSREDLLQCFVRRLTAIMRHVGRGVLSSEAFLSPPQMHLLFSIAGEPEGISVSKLAEMSGITPGAVTQFIDALVERNLVIREGDPNDRRVVKLKITPFADSHLEQLKKDHLASMAHVLSALSDDDIRQLINILSKVDIHHTREK